VEHRGVSLISGGGGMVIKIHDTGLSGAQVFTVQGYLAQKKTLPLPGPP